MKPKNPEEAEILKPTLFHANQSTIQLPPYMPTLAVLV